MPRMNDLEAPVLRGCLDLLHMRGIYAWRNNTGSMRDSTGRPVHFGLVGSSDILGVLGLGRLMVGRLLCIECKRPGGGRLTTSQRAFLERVRAEGGVALVVNDIDTLAAVLDRLAVCPDQRFTIFGEEESCE